MLVGMWELCEGLLKTLRESLSGYVSGLNRYGYLYEALRRHQQWCAYRYEYGVSPPP